VVAVALLPYVTWHVIYKQWYAQCGRAVRVPASLGLHYSWNGREHGTVWACAVRACLAWALVIIIFKRHTNVRIKRHFSTFI
jgi:hypothetical protein